MTTLTAPPATTNLPLEDDLDDRKRWTREECRRLVTLEVLEEGRYELLEGDILYKMGQSEPHVLVSKRFFLWLVGVVGGEYVRGAAPVAVSSTSEPEPDVAVTTRSRREYLVRGTPTPRDLRLAVEVSVTTLRRDLDRKAAVYARAGIPEHWVMDVEGRTLHVHRNPTADGYADVRPYTEDEFVAPHLAPGSPVRVGDLIP